MTPAPEGLVLVTGGARGIGRLLAEAFAREGRPVLLTATTQARADEAAAEIASATGGRAAGAGFVAADDESTRRLVGAVADCEERFGQRLLVLVDNAGRIESSEGPLWEADPADLRGVIETNTIGPLLLLHALVPVLLSAAAATGEPARIIDLNSGSGAKGTPAYGAYSASKAGLMRIADSVHHYGREAGLRIFELSPGVIDTRMTRSMPMHSHRGPGDWTAPEDLTALALALASGDLDAWSGRYVRAGTDDPADLARRGPAGDEGRLVLGVRAEADGA